MTMPQSKETFQWDDETVREFQVWYTLHVGEFDDHIRAFKQSKQPEEKPKDWRILSFKRIKGRDEQTFDYNANGDYTDSRSGYAITLNSLLHKGACVDSGHFVIQSVQRLSDGAVFAVGDLVTAEENSIVIPIDSFKYKNEEVLVNGKEVNTYCFFNYPVNRLQKAKPTLFTTHDGVSVKEGDRVWFVGKESFEVDVYDFVSWNTYGLTPLHDQYHYFSTEAKAKEYVLFHKPLLSLEDLLSVWDGDLSTKMRGFNMTHPSFIHMMGLAKSKL